jgi:hypothetical protein
MNTVVRVGWIAFGCLGWHIEGCGCVADLPVATRRCAASSTGSGESGRLSSNRSKGSVPSSIGLSPRRWLHPHTEDPIHRRGRCYRHPYIYGNLDCFLLSASELAIFALAEAQASEAKMLSSVLRTRDTFGGNIFSGGVIRLRICFRPLERMNEMKRGIGSC